VSYLRGQYAGRVLASLSCEIKMTPAAFFTATLMLKYFKL
jgi:hypothetical protein